MRILWLNWRDIKHPEAGGAEVFTHEVLCRLEKKGYETTLFTERFPGSSPVEYVDNVRIIRDGGKFNVYSKAKDYYNKYKKSYDFVVDEINARPFLTPKYVKDKPILALSHHVSLEAWSLELPFPLGHIGYFHYHRRGLKHYQDIPTATVSDSSKRNLEKIGLKKVFVVPEGLNIRPLDKIPEKETSPTIAFVGRLKKNKLPDHALRAFSMIKKSIPDAKMWVVGDGYMREKLERITNKEGKKKSITFFGRVDEDLKYELLSRAHLIIVPGVHEGWGLVVIESNAMGTPALAYNIPGLRDSVKDGETGILVKENSAKCLAETAIALLRDQPKLNELSRSALEFSNQFSWDNTADAFDHKINEIYKAYTVPTGRVQQRIAIERY
jgi:glycosyltransferase involved in cell wall biosynthesis